MLAVADIPFIIWSLGIYLIGVASDEVGATLPSALFLLIFSLPFVALIILPALLNKTDKKWLIFVLSILLNWTFIGWIVLLVVSINMNKEGDYGVPVPAYVEENVSTKIVKIIQSYTGIINKMVWRK